MKNFGGNPVIFEGNPYEEHSEAQHQYGAKLIASNGDIYRYARVLTTATDFVAGQAYVAQDNIANHQNVALSAAAAVGAKLVIPTVGATAVTANEYDQGTLVFNDVSPEGEIYFVTSHEANAGSLATDVRIEPGLKTVTTTSSEVSLVRNPWNNPLASTTSLLVVPVAGVPLQDWDVSVAEFGWLKTRGVAACLADATGWTDGYFVTVSNETAGALGVISDIDQEMRVGQGMATGTATEFNPVYLFVD